MYSYHNRIRQRINNGELIGIKKGEGKFAIVLIFSTSPPFRPIRPHSVYRYEKEIKKFKFDINGKDY